MSSIAMGVWFAFLKQPALPDKASKNYVFVSVFAPNSKSPVRINPEIDLVVPSAFLLDHWLEKSN
jgi:hypothetical protein